MLPEILTSMDFELWEAGSCIFGLTTNLVFNSGFAVGETQSLPQGILEGGAMPCINMGHTACKCGDWFQDIPGTQKWD